MKFYGNLPLDLYGWANEEIGVFGGWRGDGFHKAGHLRADFIITDSAHKMRTGEDKTVGQAKLLIKLATNETERPAIVGLINLEIAKEHRLQGYGRRSVELLLEAAGGELPVFDIQKSKLRFWKKNGITDIVPMGKNKEGVIRKEEPVNSLSL